METKILCCQPRLCDVNDKNKTVIATLGRPFQFSICVVANISNSNFPVLKHNNLWIKKDEQHSNIYFSWKEIAGRPHNYNLTIHIQNVSLYDLGNTSISLMTAGETGMDYAFFINPPGQYKFSFQLNERLTESDSYTFKCHVNWYPKLIEIKNIMTGHLLNSANNSIQQRESKDVDGDTLGLTPCDNTGVYMCIVTDFKNSVRTGEHGISQIDCPVIFCNRHITPLIFDSTINETVNFTLCLYNIITYKTYFNLTRISTKIHNIAHTRTFNINHLEMVYINLSIIKVLESYKGNHTVEIMVNRTDTTVEKIYRNITLNIFNKPSLCKETKNNSEINVTINGNVSMEICVSDLLTNLKSVKINENAIDLDFSETFDRQGRRLRVKQYSTDKYYLMVEIVNISEATPVNYEVKITNVVNVCLVFMFKLIVQGSLRLCKHEINGTTVSTKLHESVTLHICYTTDLGSLGFIGINNELFQVNEFDNDKDTWVSVDNISNSKQYFMQIYFKNVTIEHFKNYTILIKPVKNRNLIFSFNFLHVNVSSFDVEIYSCEGIRTKQYFYTQINKTITFCVTIKSNTYREICVKKISYTQFGLDRPNNDQLENVKISIIKNTEINITIRNATMYNFGRYDVLIQLCDNVTKIYTFYVLYEQDKHTAICQGSTNNYTLEAQPGDEKTLCFQRFGILDRSITINNITMPICSNDSNCKMNVLLPDKFSVPSSEEVNKVTVYYQWNEKWTKSFIKIVVTAAVSGPLQIDSWSSNQVLLYNIVVKRKSVPLAAKCELHQENNFTVSIGDNINITICDNISFNENIGIYFNDLQLHEASIMNKFYSIQPDTSTLPQRLVLTIKNITVKDLGNVTVLVSFNNVNNFSTTVSIQNKVVVVEEIPDSASVPYVVYIVVAVIVVFVCIVFLLVIMFVRKLKKSKGKYDEMQLQTLATIPGYEMENNIYANVRGVRENMYMNVRPLPNAPDLTKDIQERIYINSKELQDERMGVWSGDGEFDNQSRGRYISEEGLVYITVSHDSSPTRATISTRSLGRDDQVLYATLDMEKTGHLPPHPQKHRRHKPKRKHKEKKSSTLDAGVALLDKSNGGQTLKSDKGHSI